MDSRSHQGQRYGSLEQEGNVENRTLAGPRIARGRVKTAEVRCIARMKIQNEQTLNVTIPIMIAAAKKTEACRSQMTPHTDE